MPCYDPQWGSFDAATDCYVKLTEPQPPRSDPVWRGHTDGAIYTETCAGSGGTNGGTGWLPRQPPGPGAPAVGPAVLARELLARLRLLPPAVGMAPGPGRTGRVGLPVWLWNRWTGGSDTHWGRHAIGGCAGPVCVRLTAAAARTVWRMGDGRTETCTTAGTPYQRRYGGHSSPDCGHTYTRASSGLAGGVYRVTATTRWVAHWAGAGQAGDITLDLAASTTARIGELQVLVQ